MAEIKGTPGKDIYTVKSGDVFNGQEGDDEITFEKGGAAQGDSGNDTFTVPKTFTNIFVSFICSKGVLPTKSIFG